MSVIQRLACLLGCHERTILWVCGEGPYAVCARCLAILED
jgi:hypothetical protein